MFKAWHLYQFNYFKNEHSLIALYNKLNREIEKFELNKDSLDVLYMLDNFYNLRYPKRYSPVETGTDDWIKINSLVNILWSSMPQDLLAELEKIDASRKGGRILMRKKN